MKLFILYLLIAHPVAATKPTVRPPAQPCTKYNHCNVRIPNPPGNLRGWK